MPSDDTQQQVLVTYAAPQAFISSGSWKQIHASLLSQLPLRNIHWRSSTHSVLRTIQELEFNLVPLDSVRDELTSQIPVTILERPLLSIYILPCEDTDLEAYRLVYKKQIKDWLNVVTSRKHQDWLLLQLVKHDPRAPGGKLFQLKGSVLEKTKADFNTDKRDRVAQVTWAPGSEANVTTWAEFVNKIKDGLVYAFDSAISQREDEVNRSESQRQMPGWNFCTFFILKESLSNSFEGMNLFEEALMHYDELEEIFAHVLREKNLSWFGNLITPQPSDDSSPLLASDKKPYRDLILANNISVFDLRVYLLARRCKILAKLGRVSEASQKVKGLLIVFSKRLRDIEETLPKFFIESWMYNSALSAVEQCDQWSTTYNVEESKLPSYHASQGELLELSQIQLNVIGVRMNYLPKTLPFAMGLQRDISTSSSQQISNVDVCTSVSDAEFFYDLYVKVTNRVIDVYTKAKRRNFALKLHECLAALDLHRGRLAPAVATYTTLSAHYAPHIWSSLESYTLSWALDIHTRMHKEDTEWIRHAISFLKIIVECPEVSLLMHESTEYTSDLVRSLRHVSLALEDDVILLDHPAFVIRIPGQAKLPGSMDGLCLDVLVHSHLPCDVTIDEMTIMASGRDYETLRFSSRVEELSAGKSTVTLLCPVFSLGTYVVESCQIRIGRLKFQWLLRKQSQKGLLSDVLIRMPHDPLALDVQLSQPGHIELGHSPSLLVTIATGRNNASRIALKLTAAGINFRFREATVIKGHTVPTASDDGIVFSDIPFQTDLTLKVPYIESSASHILKVLVDLNYTTTSEPTITRNLRTTRTLSTILPFSVNVEDFFRGQSLISKFTISTTSHQHIRVASIRLEGQHNSSALRVISCPVPKGIATVHSAQPIHALFRLEHNENPVYEPLLLVVQYRMLREEVEEVIQDSVHKLLITSSTSHDSSITIRKLVEALENDARWVEPYELTGELTVPVLNDGDDSDPLLESLRKHLEKHRHPPQPEGNWRVMKIPVDLPRMDIVAAARISLDVNPELKNRDIGTLYAGQPVAANLAIHTSFHWGSEKKQQYSMRFDIEELAKDWLICGNKRGDFIARDDETLNVPLTMVALHHGILPLPGVIVSALPVPSDTIAGTYDIPSIDTYQVHGAEKVLVLPRGGKTTYIVEMSAT